MTFVIPFGLPGLNEMLKANRYGRGFGWARLKKKVEADIATCINGARPAEADDAPIVLDVTWIEAERLRKQVRDVDNIAAGVKFILDAMVGKGVLWDDSPRYVKGIRHTFRQGPNDRVLVTTWL